MKYNFNWSVVSRGAPYITFSNIGIGFNATSIEKLGKPEKVIAGFDEEHCVIGIKPFNGERGIKTFKFSSRVENGWVRIGCRGFMKYLQDVTGFDFSPAKRFMAQYDSKERVLYTTLKDVNAVVKKPKKKGS